jgi:hypothetical protein
MPDRPPVAILFLLLTCKFIRVATALWLLAAQAPALDTVEPFAAGLSDTELYLGADAGAAPGAPDRILGVAVVGYGVSERVSVLALGAALDASGTPPSLELGGGLIAAALARDHFDLDLLLECAWSGPSDALGLRPGLELNLDASSSMQGPGLFLLVMAPLVAELGDGRLSVVPTGRLGAYYRVHPRHELLLGYRVDYEPRAAVGAERIVLGDLALGYNVVLSPEFELITELHLETPATGERWAPGFTVGFVTTLPPP